MEKEGTKLDRLAEHFVPVPFLEQVFLYFTSEGHTSVFHFMDFVALVRISETIACSCVILSEWVEGLSFRGC